MYSLISSSQHSYEKGAVNIPISQMRVWRWGGKGTHLSSLSQLGSRRVELGPGGSGLAAEELALTTMPDALLPLVTAGHCEGNLALFPVQYKNSHN